MVRGVDFDFLVVAVTASASALWVLVLVSDPDHQVLHGELDDM